MQERDEIRSNRYLNLYEKVDDGGERFMRCLCEFDGEGSAAYAFKGISRDIQEESLARIAMGMTALELRNEGFTGRHRENDTDKPAFGGNPDWHRRRIVHDFIKKAGGIVGRAQWEIDGTQLEGYHDTVVAIGNRLDVELSDAIAEFRCNVEEAS